MNVKEILKDVYELLEDHDANPRDPAMAALSRLIEASEQVPSGDIELRALLAPGGAHEVTDQHGRKVAGVKSVAVFEDASGSSVFQVNL